ncbi:MAG: CPBP family intramembrane glutamic endopeptidase [Pseudomonadales bacterium]
MNLFPELSVWLVLAFAVLAIFTQQKFWPVLVAAAYILAAVFGLVEWIGLLFASSGFLLAWLVKKTGGWQSWVFQALLVLWALALAAHLLPGFHTLMVLDQVLSGSESTPYSLMLNLDKPLIIFGFILLMPSMLQGHRHQAVKLMTISAVALLLVLPFLGCAIDLIKPEFSLPEWLGWFVFKNLLFTCVAEEVLFRGYFQNVLSRYGTVTAVMGSSLLFGLAHFAGGLSFVFLATLAGAAYGLIYLATGRLYLVILAHFFFNLYHLAFFTYPLSQ